MELQHTTPQTAGAIGAHQFSVKVAQTVFAYQSVIHQQLLALESPAIAYRLDYADVGGGVCEGVFLSQLHYWTVKLREQRGASWDGWIFNTVEQWTAQTRLTRREQDTVRKNLFAKGILEYKRAGRSGVMHYRLDVAALLCLLAQIGVSVPEIPQKRQRDIAKAPETPRKSAKPYTDIPGDSASTPQHEGDVGINKEQDTDGPQIAALVAIMIRDAKFDADGRAAKTLIKEVGAACVKRQLARLHTRSAQTAGMLTDACRGDWPASHRSQGARKAVKGDNEHERGNCAAYAPYKDTPPPPRTAEAQVEQNSAGGAGATALSEATPTLEISDAQADALFEALPESVQMLITQHVVRHIAIDGEDSTRARRILKRQLMRTDFEAVKAHVPEWEAVLLSARQEERS